MTDPEKVLIVPVAADLARNGISVRCGPRTAANCGRAMMLARTYPGSTILTTATVSPKFGVVMGQVMKDFVTSVTPDLKVAYEEAETFDTLGEILATASFVRDHNGKFGHVIFVVEAYRKERTDFLVRHVFGHEEVDAYHSLSLTDMPRAFGTRWFWALYERVSLEWNRGRLEDLGYL